MLLKKSEDRLLFLLKSKGSGTAKELALELGMTAMGARQHLLQLEEKKLVSSHTQKAGIGRPRQYWSLTREAENRFPDTHAYLTLDLIDSIEKTFGKRGLEKLIKEKTQKTHSEYQAILNHYVQLETKIKKLTAIRTNEGYMAEYTRLNNNTYLLYENHCPICAAATKCQQFCRSELVLFQSLFEDMQVQVTRESHIIAGARRCAYRFSRSKNPSKKKNMAL